MSRLCLMRTARNMWRSRGINNKVSSQNSVNSLNHPCPHVAYNEQTKTSWFFVLLGFLHVEQTINPSLILGSIQSFKKAGCKEFRCAPLFMLCCFSFSDGDCCQSPVIVCWLMGGGGIILCTCVCQCGCAVSTYLLLDLDLGLSHWERPCCRFGLTTTTATPKVCACACLHYVHRYAALLANQHSLFCQHAGPNKPGFINQTNPLEILHNPLQAPYSLFINTPKSLPHQASAFPTTTDKRWRTPTTQ